MTLNTAEFLQQPIHETRGARVVRPLDKPRHSQQEEPKMPRGHYIRKPRVAAPETESPPAAAPADPARIPRKKKKAAKPSRARRAQRPASIAKAIELVTVAIEVTAPAETRDAILAAVLGAAPRLKRIIFEA